MEDISLTTWTDGESSSFSGMHSTMLCISYQQVAKLCKNSVTVAALSLWT